MRAHPVRTCVGCRTRTMASDLVRVVLARDGGERLQPDGPIRQPGRGAHLHPTRKCLDLAERKRAFGRALRATGPVDISALRDYVEQRAE